ncbi:MAG TPA: hypothetical protein VI076_17400 [Actinopolymorphaceae bacterium]
MSTVTSTRDVGSDATRSGPRATLWVLRVLALATSVTIVAQPLLAGFYLDGDMDALTVHGINGHVVTGFVFLELIAAVVFWLAGQGRGWPALALLGLFFAVETQVGMGYARMLGIHIPLGVTVVVLQLAFTVWVFTARSRRPRTRRGGRR